MLIVIVRNKSRREYAALVAVKFQQYSHQLSTVLLSGMFAKNLDFLLTALESVS